MKPVGYIDGYIGPLNEIRVPVLDRGFLYGDSVYEVFRTYNGIPFLFNEHYDRLLNSAMLSGMQISQSKEALTQALKDTVSAIENPDREDVYVRYQVTRGEGPIDLTPDPDAVTRLIIIVKAVPSWKQEHYDLGMTMSVPRQRRNGINSLDPNIKGGNYMNNVLALAQSREQGVDECLMLDSRGMVTECSNSNVWFVMDDRVVTPLAGNLVGLTRKSLMSLLKESGVEAMERGVHSEELPNATECFVTSATREVMPVRSLVLENGEEIIFPEGGGEMTRMAMNLYAAMIGEFKSSHQSQAWF
ncbi:MAG: aminotransferase class IV [Acidiferrobacterales bacterium]|nr:aminotransferase class IV [Acidiferrobacterales bacterium]